MLKKNKKYKKFFICFFILISEIEMYVYKKKLVIIINKPHPVISMVR